MLVAVMEPHSLTYSWSSVPNSCPSLFTALPLHKACRQQRGSGDSSSFSGQLAQELRCCHPHLTAKQRGVRWAGLCSCKARLSLSLKLTTSTWRSCPEVTNGHCPSCSAVVLARLGSQLFTPRPCCCSARTEVGAEQAQSSRQDPTAPVCTGLHKGREGVL